MMRQIPFLVLLAAASGCADDTHLTQPPRTQQYAADSIPAPAYELVKISETLGGSVVVGTGLNNRGWVAGYSTLEDDSRHAVLWRRDTLIDLGTLGGRNSAVQWPGINSNGMVVGISFTAEADPHNANWSCEAFMGASDRTCRGFYWDGDDMQALETLGGYNGFATSVNNHGQIVGWAETMHADTTCKSPQVLGFRAVLWEPRAGSKQELPPLPGDPASAATAINDRGQVVGISGKCYVAVGDSSARASVLWENGVPREIPNLGGNTWNTPMDINEGGNVVGFSNLGDLNGAPRFRAFLWTGGSTVAKLDSLPGDNLTQAYAINARRQVVGRSCGPTGCRAMLWENGARYDLNQLTGAGADRLVIARHINDAGVITGNLTEAGTGKTLMYIAFPRGRRPND